MSVDKRYSLRCPTYKILHNELDSFAGQES